MGVYFFLFVYHIERASGRKYRIIVSYILVKKEVAGNVEG